jgi:hypothetical protein
MGCFRWEEDDVAMDLRLGSVQRLGGGFRTRLSWAWPQGVAPRALDVQAGETFAVGFFIQRILGRFHDRFFGRSLPKKPAKPVNVYELASIH